MEELNSLPAKECQMTNYRPIFPVVFLAHLHIHTVAKYYGIPVVVHTDHAAKKWLPWISGLLDAGEAYFKEKKQPLFSSHMLDLSEEPLEENIHTSVEFFKRMKPLGMAIEIELGVTGGEEDGVDNSGVENDKLYTQPEHVAYAYTELSKVGPLFGVAAAFGNVHGVYSPGNVELRPVILKNSQDYIAKGIENKTETGLFCFPWWQRITAISNSRSHWLWCN